MSDLIKRSDAIRALNREKSDWNCDYNHSKLKRLECIDETMGEREGE